MNAIEATWTADRIDQLTKLWNEGVPAKEIGRRIGVTKNMVIGKANRLSLPPRATRRETRAGHWTNRARAQILVDTPLCFWPLGHPGDSDFHYCGEQPEPGKPYCTKHCKIAYIRPEDLAEYKRLAA